MVNIWAVTSLTIIPNMQICKPTFKFKFSIFKLNTPHWGVQSRFRVIYVCIYVCMSVCLVCQINCVGGITWTKHAHAQSPERNFEIAARTLCLRVCGATPRFSAEVKIPLPRQHFSSTILFDRKLSESYFF